VAALATTIGLQEELLAREREQDSREGTISTLEDGLVAFTHTLGEVRPESDAKHVKAEAVQ
jgi:hypothetical protein